MSTPSINLKGNTQGGRKSLGETGEKISSPKGEEREGEKDA